MKVFTPPKIWGKNGSYTTLKNGRFWGSHGIATGGHPQKKNNDGNTALHLAARMGHVGSLGVGGLQPIDGGPWPDFFTEGFLCFNTSLFFKQNSIFIHVCLLSGFFVGDVYIYYMMQYQKNTNSCLGAWWLYSV